MTDPQEAREFAEKMAAFISIHRRILAEFGRSLANARHFLKLAGRSLEREPLETETMLEQIKEIDLLGHLTNQFEEYRSISALLLPPHTSVTDIELQGQIAEIQTKYEGLLEEAEDQMEAIDNLLATLQTRH